MAAATVQEGWFTLNPDSIETNIQAGPKRASNKALPTLSRAGKDCSPQDTVLTPCYTRNEFLFLYLIIYAWIQGMNFLKKETGYDIEHVNQFHKIAGQNFNPVSL